MNKRFWVGLYRQERQVNAAVMSEQEAEAQWRLIRFKWVAIGFVCGIVVGMAAVLYWLSTLLVVEPVLVDKPVAEEKGSV